MEYQILDTFQAAEQKRNPTSKFVKTIPFNYAKVFLLNDGSYLVTPLNPFGNSLLTANKALLESWVADEYFPSDENLNEFYQENQLAIDTLPVNAASLKADLLAYIDKNSTINTAVLDETIIDNIYALLRKKRKFKVYKLNFMVLAGEFLISQFPATSYRWGVLKIKQALNPVINLVIVTDEDKKGYFNLEDSICGKWNYVGMPMMMHALASDMTKTTNEFEEVSVLKG